VTGGIPNYEWVKAEDIDDEGMFASWMKPSARYENGCIQLDETHAVLLEQLNYWKSQYPPTMAGEVERRVKNCYADVAVAKVAHIHALTGALFSEEQRDAMLENHSLTASLLGLLSEDAYISPQLGGLGAKRKKSEDSLAT